MEQGTKVFAKAVCHDCGGEAFDIALTACETIIICLKCRAVWERPSEVGTGGSDERSQEAVGEVGDESKDLVSAVGGEADEAIKGIMFATGVGYPEAVEAYQQSLRK